MNFLTQIFFKRFIKVGTLGIIDVKNRRYTFQGKIGPAMEIRLHTRAVEWAIVRDPSLGVGEGYMNGTLTIEKGDIYDFLNFCALNIGQQSHIGLLDWAKPLHALIKFIKSQNTLRRARKNVAHHYDVGNDFYALFLDKNRQYSCAYFENEHDSLEQAQINKMQHIANKLHLKRNHKVLDIGSGWGGLSFHLAKTSGAEVSGLTLSEEQHKYATTEAKNRNLSDQVAFHLRDYRQETTRYDRIISVGMFEHVGAPYYQAFFKKTAQLLKDDGVMVLHSIGRLHGPGSTNAWTQKYIFPGGYAPALSEVMHHIEKAGLMVTDIEILRLHYAKTVQKWRENFTANRPQIIQMYDERFYRMWEFYLSGAEAAFRREGLMVFQIQLTKKINTLPLTRDYMYPMPATALDVLKKSA